MDRIARITLALVACAAVGGGCAPSLPRMSIAVARGDRSEPTGARRESVVWVRLSWDGPGPRR